MSLHKLIFTILIVCLIFSCSDNGERVGQNINDTTEVIKFAIQTALSRHRLPEVGALKQGNLIDNSIFLSADSLPDRLIPSSIDTLKFKLVKRSQICSLITHMNDSISSPNFLDISHFEKNDSCYNVYIQSLSCIPYGGGGSLGINIFKKGDSLKAHIFGSWSIN